MWSGLITSFICHFGQPQAGGGWGGGVKYCASLLWLIGALPGICESTEFVAALDCSLSADAPSLHAGKERELQ
jgi:hypothetical protein